MNNPSWSDDPSHIRVPEEPHDERNNFDDSTNALWSLYEKDVESRDKVRIQKLKDDMDGVSIFVCRFDFILPSAVSRGWSLTSFSIQAGLFSAVLSTFAVPKIQDLKVNPADQSVYYQRQSVQILAQISQQIASTGMGAPISLNLTHPLPYSLYPAFRPSASDRRVAVCWLVGLTSSLCAAVFAMLVQQWANALLHPIRRSDSFLKTLWIQTVLSEGVDRLQFIARAVPKFLHLSLILFILGLSDTILVTDPRVGIATVVPIAICGFCYIFSVFASITKPRWPYQNPLSNEIWSRIHNLPLALYNSISLRRVLKSGGIEADPGHLSTDPKTASKPQDVRAVRWLLDKIYCNGQVDTLLLAIPATFDQEWSQNVWKAVVGEARSAPPEDVRDKGVSHLQGATVFDLCTRLRQLFKTYNHNMNSMSEAEHKRMQGCVETVACLVCCADVPPSSFGEIGGVLNEVGHHERINEPLTIRSNSPFAVRWTCLSLVAIRQTVMAEGNGVRALADFAVSGIARFQSDYGAPDEPALNGAERIDGYLKTAWEHVEGLHRAFEPWDQSRTKEDIRNVLEGCEFQISELERIGNEVSDMNDVDQRISILQEAMEIATHKLTRRLPGLSFDELKQCKPILVTEDFHFPIFGSTAITSPFIFAGQHLQSFLALGRGLRNIVKGQNFEGHQDVLERLESIGKIPISLRRLNHLMRRQLRRLQDLRDGGGFGFTVELFFLALRQFSSASLTPKSEEMLYLGTFKVITSGWMDSRDSFGTQGILLDLVCDLVVEARGPFSDFPYPTYIVDELLKLVGKIVDGHRGLHAHINDAVEELWNAYPRECAFWGLGLQERALLRDKALEAIKPH